MENTIEYKGDHYDELVARQVDQYKETEFMHDLPGIFNYWSSKYISPNFFSLTGSTNSTDFYVSYFQQALKDTNSKFLLSIGSGDCSIEIDIVKKLLSKGERDFFFICLELSPLFVEKARIQIDKEGLGDIIAVSKTDLNNWEPKTSFAGVMAHHSLHHILNLEHVFGLIKKHLAPNGKFVTSDIIGRNGHMRWPEALSIVRQIWEHLPRKYKYSNQSNRYYDYFENWDCSVEGFEGIRAQDILPLLIKSFSFEVFFGFGNLIDTFIDRNFGPNFNPENKDDIQFIDTLHALDEKLISEGILKPTGIIAAMTNKQIDKPRLYNNWSPEFAVRDPLAPAREVSVKDFLESISYKLQATDNPLNEIEKYKLATKLLFTKNGNGKQYFKNGWNDPEDDFTWSSGEAASLIFPMEKPVTSDLIATFELIPYKSTVYPENKIDVIVKNTILKTMSYSNSVDSGLSIVTITVPLQLIKNEETLEVEFRLPNKRQPQYEGGSDVRPVCIAMFSAKISKE